MPTFRASLAGVLFAILAVSPAVGARVHHAAGVHHASIRSHVRRHVHGRRGSRSRRPRGQQAIAPERVTQIQQALIREHYLTGPVDGQWDATTKAAMEKYQADQGWQTKLTPDSRALKKLGLGPDYSNAINAKNSSFVNPPPADTIPPDQTTGFAEAAGVNQ